MEHALFWRERGGPDGVSSEPRRGGRVDELNGAPRFSEPMRNLLDVWSNVVATATLIAGWQAGKRVYLCTEVLLCGKSPITVT